MNSTQFKANFERSIIRFDPNRHLIKVNGKLANKRSFVVRISRFFKPSSYDIDRLARNAAKAYGRDLETVQSFQNIDGVSKLSSKVAQVLKSGASSKKFKSTARIFKSVFNLEEFRPFILGVTGEGIFTVNQTDNKTKLSKKSDLMKFAIEVAAADFGISTKAVRELKMHNLTFLNALNKSVAISSAGDAITKSTRCVTEDMIMDYAYQIVEHHFTTTHSLISTYLQDPERAKRTFDRIPSLPLKASVGIEIEMIKKLHKDTRFEQLKELLFPNPGGKIDPRMQKISIENFAKNLEVEFGTLIIEKLINSMIENHYRQLIKNFLEEKRIDDKNEAEKLTSMIKKAFEIENQASLTFRKIYIRSRSYNYAALSQSLNDICNREYQKLYPGNS